MAASKRSTSCSHAACRVYILSLTIPGAKYCSMSHRSKGTCKLIQSISWAGASCSCFRPPVQQQCQCVYQWTDLASFKLEHSQRILTHPPAHQTCSFTNDRGSHQRGQVCGFRDGGPIHCRVADTARISSRHAHDGHCTSRLRL